MIFPVVNHADACFFQPLCHSIAHGQHIVGFVQRAVVGQFLIGCVSLFIALGGMAVKDEHRWMAVCQRPFQRGSQQGGKIRGFAAGVLNFNFRLRVKGGAGWGWRIIHGRRGLGGKGKRKMPGFLPGIRLYLLGAGFGSQCPRRPQGQACFKKAEYQRQGNDPGAEPAHLQIGFQSNRSFQKAATCGGCVPGFAQPL